MMARSFWTAVREIGLLDALRSAWTHPKIRKPRRRPHVHYCEVHDKRWACAIDLCLLHEAAPCPDRPHPPAA
jgi:hypothetical protein